MHTSIKSLLGISVLCCLFACSKSYTCSCEVDHYDANGMFTHTAVNTATIHDRESKAEEECAFTESEYNPSQFLDAECRLIVNP